MGADETAELTAGGQAELLSAKSPLLMLRESTTLPGDVSFIQDEKSWQNLLGIRSFVANSEVIKQNLPVYYPASGRDIARPLGFTEATNFIFVDFSYTAGNAARRDRMPDYAITSMGGKIISDQTEGVMGKGGKRIAQFEWAGKLRTLVLYAEDATKFTPPEISAGTAMTLLVGVGGEPENKIDTPQFWSGLLESITVGGFTCMPPAHKLHAEELGFTKILSPEVDEQGIPHGYPLFQKFKAVPNLSELVERDFRLYTKSSQPDNLVQPGV